MPKPGELHTDTSRSSGPVNRTELFITSRGLSPEDLRIGLIPKRGNKWWPLGLPGGDTYKTQTFNDDLRRGVELSVGKTTAGLFCGQFKPNYLGSVFDDRTGQTSFVHWLDWQPDPGQKVRGFAAAVELNRPMKGLWGIDDVTRIAVRNPRALSVSTLAVLATMNEGFRRSINDTRPNFKIPSLGL